MKKKIVLGTHSAIRQEVVDAGGRSVPKTTSDRLVIDEPPAMRPVRFTPASIAIVPRYSGDESEKFWALVNSLPNESRWELYFAGVLLQEMEHRVLDRLKAALAGDKPKGTRRGS